MFYDFFIKNSAFILGIGVYISRIEEGSVAERAGLRPGDTILEVNGTPFTTLTHDEALKVSCFLLVSLNQNIVILINSTNNNFRDTDFLRKLAFPLRSSSPHLISLPFHRI